ncbi:MAG: hypothetical protein JW882_10985 [Deltaproteobacteria bacterium]|nr:hypothetical protein [Deltaproteobacteria bacterium]
MDNEEYNTKYINLRILKSIQEYLKADNDSQTSVYPISVPDELLLQILKFQGARNADQLIHDIFKLGLEIWSEELFQGTFGSTDSLKSFINLLKKQNKEVK